MMSITLDEIEKNLTNNKIYLEPINSNITNTTYTEMKPYIESLDSIKLNTYYLDNKLFVNIDMPDIDVRPPIDIVLCIDVSYSMSTEASLKGDSNETVAHGFSVLSLSNFVPTILFGLFTALAMILAMLGVLLTLPTLITKFKI